MSTSDNGILGNMTGEITHKMVLDYLKHTGRTKAAECLNAEADLEPRNDVEDSTLLIRGRIRRRILQGNIIGAIEDLNDMNFNLLETKPELFFRLKLQAFIEMVRMPGYNLEQVLAFASEEFVPCPDNLLPELELCMALLAFENPNTSPLKEVLNGRETLAAEVNDIILQYEKVGNNELVSLLKEAIFMERYCGKAEGCETFDPRAKASRSEHINEVENFLLKFL